MVTSPWLPRHIVTNMLCPRGNLNVSNGGWYDCCGSYPGKEKNDTSAWYGYVDCKRSSARSRVNLKEQNVSIASSAIYDLCSIHGAFHLMARSAASNPTTDAPEISATITNTHTLLDCFLATKVYIGCAPSSLQEA